MKNVKVLPFNAVRTLKATALGQCGSARIGIFRNVLTCSGSDFHRSDINFVVSLTCNGMKSRKMSGKVAELAGGSDDDDTRQRRGQEALTRTRKCSREKREKPVGGEERAASMAAEQKLMQVS